MDALERLHTSREERDRLSALINSIGDEVWYADANGKFTLANPVARKEFALGPGEVDVGELAASLEVLRPDGTPRPVEEAPPLRALRGEVVRNQDEMIRTPATGELRYRQVSATPVRGTTGEIVGSVSVVRDVTEQRLAEAALRRRTEELEEARRQAENEKRRLEAVMQALPIGIAITDAQGGSIESNAAFEQLWGGARPDVHSVDDYGAYRAWWSEGGRPVAPEEWASARAVRDGVPVVGQLLELERFDGTRASVLNGAAPVRDAEGNVIGSAVAVQDVTELRRAQEALRDREASLREADARKDDFLAILSHELRNPLAPIRNGLCLLRQAEPGGERARRALEVIERQVGQLTRLVNDLLDVTRIARGKTQIERSPVELSALLEGVAEDHRSQLTSAGVELELALHGRPWIDADAERVTQAVGNLLQNAAKFTGRGGRVTLSLEEDARARTAVVRVRDTGQGIAADVLGRLFQPFTQADGSLDRAKGGLGLGLALVKGLVELHGGSAEAHSDGPGRGAVFTLRFPLRDTPGPAPMARRRARVATRRVLVIEDNVDSADSLREVLRLAGHEVEVAYDGAMGVARARGLRPDVVLCDIGLPGMDGYEIARTLRAEPSLAGARLVALTGYARPEDLRRAAEAGFDGHLSKPPDLDELHELLAGDGAVPG